LYPSNMVLLLSSKIQWVCPVGFFDHVEENTHKVQLKDSLLLNLQDQVNRRIYCTKIYKQKTKKHKSEVRI
jgi:uncharacterized ion transporter superfamily protein YfcC